MNFRKMLEAIEEIVSRYYPAEECATLLVGEPEAVAAECQGVAE